MERVPWYMVNIDTFFPINYPLRFSLTQLSTHQSIYLLFLPSIKLKMARKNKLSISSLLLVFLFASVYVSKPTRLRASNVTYKSVRVDWSPVLELFILGYRVLLQNVPINETFPWNKTYALITGLRSNTKYVIGILPVHGLTDEKHPVGNTESIIITTKQVQGKQFSNCVEIRACIQLRKMLEP